MFSAAVTINSTGSEPVSKGRCADRINACRHDQLVYASFIRRGHDAIRLDLTPAMGFPSRLLVTIPWITPEPDTQVGKRKKRFLSSNSPGR